MRPIQLGLSAFGPFIEPVQLDFRRLEPHELFLIHGPIGSGKTALLDGISFALYGVSSGGERSAMSMRNDLADSSLSTTVVLDFSRGHAQYRVKRQLSGETRQAQIWNLTGIDWPDPWSEPILPPLPLDSGWDGVTQKVTEVLGLGEGEFRRSILIPQGQFRLLLSASPAEREHILKAIFNTAHQQVVPMLEQAVGAQQERLKAAWERREELAQEMQLDSGEDVLDRLDQQKKTLQRLEIELFRYQKLQESFVVEAGKSAVFQERSQEQAEANRQLSLLEARDAELKGRRESLARYRAASSLAEYESQLHQAEADVRGAESELERVQTLLLSQGGDYDTPNKSIEGLKASQELHAELKVELQRLEEAVDCFHAYQEAQQELESQGRRVEQLQDQLHQVAEALRESQERLSSLESTEKGPTQVEKIEALQSQISQLQRLRRRDLQQIDLHGNVERLRLYLGKAEQRCQEMDGRVAGLEEEILRLQGSSFATQASFLAAQLQPGKPCMVCGSPEHPQPAQAEPQEPAQPARGLIDRSRERQSPQKLLEQKKLQLKQAQALAKKLSQERSDQAILLARLESKLETIQDEARDASPPSAAEIEETLSRLTEELRILEKDASGRGKEENEKLRFQQRQQKLSHSHGELASAHRQAELRLAQLQTRVAERQRRLTPGLDSLERIEANRRQIVEDLELVALEMQGGTATLIQSTSEQAARQAALQAAERGLEMARDRLRLAREIYEARSEAAGFASLEEVSDSLRSLEEPPDELHTLLQRHELELGSARDRAQRAARLVQESLEQAGAPQDQEALQQKLESLVQERGACQNQIQELQARSEEYQRCIEEIHQLEPQLSAAKRLLRIATGENRHNLSFQQYLLSQHMENVLLAANHRLSWMTRGRYSLHPAGKGLEIEVRDHLSGQLRPVATLSGGESFLASLALALGLSDCVTYAGSAQAVEALFIDEGFGNLDDDALELAIQGLTRLQNEGRLIGVVSHLPELKQRIPARLEVQATPGGSRLHLIVPR